jgi:hypothetical protein
MTAHDDSTFRQYSIPLVFEGRYFIREPGDPPCFSVVHKHEGNHIFEVRKNQPSMNPVSYVSISSDGIIMASSKRISRFLYKFCPASETTIVFTDSRGNDIIATISEKRIQVGDVVLLNSTFDGDRVGLVVDRNGRTGIGASVPESLLVFLMKRLANY